MAATGENPYRLSRMVDSLKRVVYYRIANIYFPKPVWILRLFVLMNGARVVIQCVTN